ncbi:hypothetical protein J2Z83_003907 [Virgibacillus natechei]|uniref:Uncharacterized protein n=1 Tax=Virgibacillus natechei TaxID=1216297 RepID=A0ABS4IL93_9BACI|nr:hypothetical protein [Virgibacillus natechei]
MNKKKQFSFEEIFKQNERRVQYHLRQLRIQDPHQEFYQAHWGTDPEFPECNLSIKSILFLLQWK